MIESEYGVSYRSGSVYSLLERLGMLSEGAAWSSREGGRRSSGVLEKGGLGEALAGAGVTTETVLGFADEMRVGTSWNGAQGVGSSWREGVSTSAVGVRVEVPVLCGGRT